MMRLSYFAILFVFAFSGIKAQEFEIPKNYEMQEAGDYEKYHEDIIACSDWLQSVGPNEEGMKRAAASKFLITWVTGTPSITMELHGETLEYVEKNPDLMTIFMGAWSAHFLRTGDTSQVGGSLAGLNAVIDYYVKFKDDLNRDRSLKKLLKLREKGELREYVEKIYTK